MIYEYECALCERRIDVTKPIKFIDSVELCPVCGAEMHRCVSTPAFKIDFVHQKKEWNPGLGIWVRNRNDIREAMAKYKDEHGSELIEVGNERIEKHIEPIEKKIDRKIDEAFKEAEKLVS